MASIQRITSPLTGKVSYRAQVRVKGHPKESETFPNRKEAEQWSRSVEAAIREGRHFPHAAARRTSFDALARDYLDTVAGQFGEKELQTRERELTTWAEQFAGLTLAQVTTDRISQARDAIAAGTYTRAKPRKDKKTGEVIPPKEYTRSGATINRYMALLSAVFTFAVKERRLLDQNPMPNIARKKEAPGRVRFLTEQEREALLEACAQSAWPLLHTLVVLAISTGARRSELTNLRWADIDFKGKRAIVRKTKNNEPKSLPLVGKALEELRALKLQNSARSEWVFPHPSGHPGPLEHFEGYWRKARKAAGLSNFRFHDLRHTCASYLASQGASLLEIAEVLGHKTLAMVKRYSHLTQSHTASVVEKMARKHGL
jgi:integrase